MGHRRRKSSYFKLIKSQSRKCEKKIISMEEDPKIKCLGRLQDLLSTSTHCADCDSPNPEWASLAFGIFICLKCAGYHRSLGTHITLVRSLTLDDWTPSQVTFMEQGGNERFHKFMQNLQMNQYYHLPEVLFYTEVLKAKVEGRAVKEYRESDWIGLVAPHNQIDSSSGLQHDSSKSTKKVSTTVPAAWVSDVSSDQCMLCSVAFTMLKRRHHCRRCGKLVCATCAPAGNTRPIMEWGLRQPVRHCRACYKSPALQWS